MLVGVHARLTLEALSRQLSPRALDSVVSANLAQDNLRYQLGHDEFHFDNNSLSQGLAYIAGQHLMIPPALERGDPSSAWAAFGRLAHAAQDFYSHTNYVALWLARHPESVPGSPVEIDPLDPDILAGSHLRSAKLYYPLEALYFLPWLRALALRLLPSDSHAHMNLDSESQGWRFAYAFAAALQRTRFEFEQLRAHLSPALFSLFCDLPRV